MSNEQYAFLRRSDLPTTAALQAAIDASPFMLTVDPQMDTAATTGFVPCTICNVESGVEIDFDSDAETLAPFADMIGDRNCCLVFRWGGSMAECACAMVLSYVLAANYNAIVSYEGEPPPDDLDSFRDDTIAIHKDAKLTLP